MTDLYHHCIASQAKIARCIIPSLFLLTLGFKACVPSTLWSANNEGKTPLIIPQNAQNTPAVHPLNQSQPESFESYQIRILRNQSHLQTEKIKALREELRDVTQKLHELKPQLFKKGDPADQAKIADLTSQLGVKEVELNRLIEHNKNLNSDLQGVRKKMSEMDTIKDALTTMVEKQRAAKDHLIANFKKQIGEFRETAASEKNELLQKLQQHAETLQTLEGELQEKHQTIGRLDTIATEQDSQLTQRNADLNQLKFNILALYDEILSHSDHYVTVQQTTDQQLKSLTEALSEEQQQRKKFQDLQEETKWLSDLYTGMQGHLKKEIAQLENSLKESHNKQETLSSDSQIAKADAEARKIELALLLTVNGDIKAELTERLNELQTALEQEQSRTQRLERQFLIMLSHHESGQQHAEIIEKALDELDTLFAQHQIQAAAQSASSNQTIGNLLSYLDEAEHHIQIHQTNNHELDNQLSLLKEKAVAQEHAHLEKTTILQTLLDDSQNKALALDEDLKAYQQILRETKAQIQTLEQRHTDSYLQLSSKLSQLTEELKEELQYSFHTQVLLDEAMAYINQLEVAVDAHQDHLSSKISQLADLQEHALYVAQLLETANKQISDLESTNETNQKGLASTNKNLELLEQESLFLEVMLDDANLHIATLEENLNIHKNEAADKSNQLDDLQEHSLYVEFLLEDAKKHIGDLEENLSHRTDALKNQSAEIENLQEHSLYVELLLEDAKHHINKLEESLTAHKNELFAKTSHIEILNKLHETEKNEWLDYFNSLLEEHANELQPHLNKISMMEQDYLFEQDHRQLYAQLSAQLKADLQQTQMELVESLARQASAEDYQTLADEYRQKAEAFQNEAALARKLADEALNQIVRFQEDLKSERDRREALETDPVKRSLEEYKLTAETTSNQLNTLEAALKAEKTRREALEKDLRLARFNYIQEQSSARNLEQMMSHANQKINKLESHIAAQQEQLQQLQQVAEQSTSQFAP